jgi:hypothetical protein
VSVITMLVSASEWVLAIREACDHQSARTKQIGDGPQQSSPDVPNAATLSNTLLQKRQQDATHIFCQEVNLRDNG